MSFSEWKTYKLGDLVTFQRGHDLAKTEFVEGEFPIAGSNGIIGYHNKFTTKAPSLTVGRSGNLGTPHFYKENFWAHNTTLYVKEFHKSDPRFIYYLLQTLDLKQFNSGSAVPSLNRNYIHPIEVIAPNLTTQQRIASILSSLDDAIELNQQINKTLEEMAKAIFKEWFVDFNFPNATGKFQETEIGKIPVGWKVGKLGDIYKTTSGGTPSRAKLEYYENGIYQWVKSKELNNSFIIDTEEKITADALKKSSAKLVPKYSVMIAMYGATVGEIGIISNEATCNQAICAFLPNSDYPFSFIYQFLLLNKQDIISQAVGSAQQNISQQLLLNYALAIPPSETVKAFHKIVEPLFFQIEQCIKENQSLINLRDTLLPKLMKGEIEINSKELANER